MKKAIIFDMGGVLVDLDIPGCKQYFKTELGYDEIETVLDPCHQKGIFGQLEEGLLSGDEFRRIVKEGSRPGVTDEDVNQAMYKILVGIEPYKIDLLHRLAKDYDLYILSNNNEISIVCSAGMFKDAGFGLDTHFKKCYMSYEMKVLKPAAAFYQAVMDDIGLPPSEMLFIDDSQLNVDAAVAAGLPAIYYKPGTDLSQLLDDYLANN
jgi:putative hydrolase of the HAD superfamily